MKVLYVTGYKSFELGIFKNNDIGVHYIKKVIKQRLGSFIDEGLEWLLITGQQGTELWAAEAAMELRDEKEYPLKVGVITPYLNQEESWKEENKLYYQGILEKADFSASIYDKPYEAPYQLRVKNQYMVQKSDAMLLLYEQEKEGSPKYVLSEAVKQAEKTGYPIYWISFDDLQQAAEEEQWDQ